MSGTLFLVGTPIGNLGDLTDRARATLGSVDLVAAEDTRRTGALLRSLGIRTPLRSLFVGNEEQRGAQLLDSLRGGADVALVSDAGMPGVADPGYALVRDAVAAGIDVRVVPGPSSVTAALVVSGFPTDRFAFEGFLPRTAAARRARLADLVGESRTTVLLESPRRAVALLTDVAALMPDRRVALCRELTKVHEEVLRGTSSEVLARLGGKDPRGEVVLVLEGAAPAATDVATLVERARQLVAAGVRKRDAAATVARGTGIASSEIYRALVG